MFCYQLTLIFKNFNMKTFSFIILAITVTRVTLAVNLVERLFKNHINDAKCFLKCRDVETEVEKQRCDNFCKMLLSNPSTDICSLTSVCTGGCRDACSNEKDKIDTPTVFNIVTMTHCQLSWKMEASNANVVFLVSGQDRAGKWNLITNKLEDTQLEMDTVTAAKMEKINVFAIEAHRVADIVTLDVSENVCLEKVAPAPRELVIDDNGVEVVIDETEILHKTGSSLITTIVLSLLCVFVILFTTAIIYIKFIRKDKANVLTAIRTENGNKKENIYELVPELPYKAATLKPSVDSLIRTPSLKITKGQVQVVTETLLKPTITSLSLTENHVYEEVEISS